MFSLRQGGVSEVGLSSSQTKTTGFSITETGVFVSSIPSVLTHYVSSVLSGTMRCSGGLTNLLESPSDGMLCILSAGYIYDAHIHLSATDVLFGTTDSKDSSCSVYVLVNIIRVAQSIDVEPQWDVVLGVG